MVKRILVVDDDSEDLQTIKSILEKDGFEVDAVSDGADAFDALRRNKFSLILIDINMPTLSGYDLLRLMRERVDRAVPIIYVSIVLKSDVDMRGVDGFVQKPFSPKVLLSEVRKIIR